MLLRKRFRWVVVSQTTPLWPIIGKGMRGRSQISTTFVRESSAAAILIPEATNAKIKLISRSVDDTDSSCVVEIKELIIKREYETAANTFISVTTNLLEAGGSRKLINQLLELVLLFFPPGNRGLEVFTSESLQQRFLVQTLSFVCKAGDFGWAFRVLVVRLAQKDSCAEVINGLVGQAPPSRQAELFNAIVECFQFGQVPNSCIGFGDQLFRRMIELNLPPTAEACGAIINCQFSQAYYERPSGSRAYEGGKRAFYQARRLIPYLGKACCTRLLVLFPIYESFSATSQIEHFLLMASMIEQGISLPNSACCKAILTCEKLLAIPSPGEDISFKIEDLGRRIKTILKLSSRIDEIPTRHISNVVIKSFSQLAIGEPSAKIDFIKKLASEDVWVFNSALIAIGSICPDAMHNVFLEMNISFNSYTLECLLKPYLDFNRPHDALRLFKSLTEEMKTIMPHAKAISLAIMAAGEVHDLETMRRLWEGYINTCCRNEVASDVYVRMMETFRKTDMSLVKQLLDHLESNPCIGPTGEIYEIAFKAYASADRDYHSLLDMYKYWFLERRRAPCPTIYSHLFNALSRSVFQEPTLCREVLHVARCLSKDMEELHVIPMHNLFGSQIKLFGLVKDFNRSTSLFEDFVAFCKRNASNNVESSLLVVNTYIKYCRPEIPALIKILLDLKISPNCATYQLLFQYLVDTKSSSSAFLEVARLNPKSALEKYPFSNIQLIAHHLHKLEGAWSMERVVESMGWSDVPGIQFQLNILVIELVMLPSPHTIQDPTPLVAKWLNRILDMHLDPVALKQTLDTLWGLSNAALPSGPWPLRSRFRKILERISSPRPLLEGDPRSISYQKG